jgi:DNA-binding PadR family transcriptional regulator
MLKPASVGQVYSTLIRDVESGLYKARLEQRGSSGRREV